MLPLLTGTILPSNQPQRKPRPWLLLGTFLLFGLLTIFVNLGRWLIREDPLQHASAIAVLSGRMPSRALEAAPIYRGGFSPEVWLAHSPAPRPTRGNRSLPFSTPE